MKKKMQQMFFRNSAICLSFVIFFIASSAFAQDILIISNKDVPEKSLNTEELQQIFLGKKSRWSDDRGIRFATLSGGDIHKYFLKNFIRKTEAQFIMYWKKMVFTGKGGMPDMFDSPEEMISFITGNPGSVGYIPASHLNDAVKVIPVN